VLRVASEEEGGADQTARGPQDRVGQPQGCQGDRWCRIQAFQDQGRAQVDRQGLHRHAPEAEGELEEVLQGLLQDIMVGFVNFMTS